jgi:hypothetical protein
MEVRRHPNEDQSSSTMHASGSKSTVAMPYAEVLTILEAPVRTNVVEEE